MKRFMYLLVLLLLSTQLAFSLPPTDSVATRPRSSLSFGFGLNSTSLKNETISSLTHSGLGVPVSLAYRYETTRSKQYLQLNFLNHTLRSRFGNETSEVRGGLSYTYLRRIHGGPQTNLYAGIEIGAQVAFRSNPFGPNNVSGELINPANATILIDRSMKRHKIEAQLAVSVVGYNIRTYSNGYFISATEGTFKEIISAGRWESIPDFLNGYVRLTYFPPPQSTHFGWRFDYVGSFQQFRSQQYLGILQNQLTTSLSYTF